jgi:glycosyltransferase involved in cell wall biosynthesis
MNSNRPDNILTGMALKESLNAIKHNHRVPLIHVGRHSPAYHFPNLPAPTAIFHQKHNPPVCFWPQFDWHLLFARAMGAAHPDLGGICLRPDERAEEPVGWQISDNLISVHFPSTVHKRLAGADGVEDSPDLAACLKELYQGPPFPWTVFMAPGMDFTRGLMAEARAWIPPGHLLAQALGDTPPLFSGPKLKSLLVTGQFRDKIRFIKHFSNRLLHQKRERVLYRAIDLLWVPTEESRRHWQELVNCPVAFTSGGYDAEVWHPGDKGQARRTLGFKEEEIIILSNCVLIPKKKLDDLLQAVSLIKEKKDVKLIVSGYGENSEKERLEHLTKNLNLKDRVIFTGYVEEDRLVLFYQAADVFVHLSAAEGGPTSCKQALAANLPVVMTPVGSVGKFIQKTGLGKLFPVGDIASCAQAIMEVLDQKDNPNTSEPARDLWSWEARGQQMVADLLNFLSSGRTEAAA